MAVGRGKSLFKMKNFFKRFSSWAGLLIVLRADLLAWIPGADGKQLSVHRTNQGAGKQCHHSPGVFFCFFLI